MKSTRSSSDTYKFETEGQVLEGIWEGHRTVDVHGRQARIGTVKQVDGSEASFWLTAVLGKELDKVMCGTAVEIEYLGKKGPDHMRYHSFDVRVPDDTELIDIDQAADANAG